MMRFEWKKIFERRLNVIAMILGYILMGICVFSFISQLSFYDKNTGTYIEGTGAVWLSRERAENQTNFITDEYITQLVREIQSYGINDPDSDEAYEKVARPLGDIFYFVSKNYTNMQENVIDRGVLYTLDVTEGAHFYEQRMKKITDYLNLDFSYGNFKEAEKTYWTQKAGNIEIPFRWGDKSVMDIIWSVVALGIYLIFVVIVCVSSVFSSEYESGAASLLLTTRYGKNRLIGAKIITSLLFLVGYLSVGMVLAVGAVGLFLGFPGASLPVQLWNSVIPYRLTVGEACLLNFGMLLLVGAAVTLFLLFCSAKLRSSMATVVIGTAVMIAPAFFQMSKKSGLWNHINCLFPINVLDLKKMLGSFISYTVGDCVISYLGMAVIAYAVIGAVSLLLIRRSFVKAR